MTAAQMRDGEATKAAILRAAEKLFIESGFARVSLSEIAGQSGVTKSLIHHHFGSKEALWHEVKLHRFRKYAQAERELLTRPGAGIQVLEDSIRAYFRFLQENPEMVRLMGWAHLERDTECMGEVGLLIQQGVERLRQAQEHGMLRADVDPRHIVISFLGLVTHWFTTKHEFCQPTAEDPKCMQADANYLDDMLRIFFEGVLPPKGEPPRGK